MKETYLSRDFRKTVARHFPIEARELNAAFDVRLNGLLAENADASKEERYHLKKQILRATRSVFGPAAGFAAAFATATTSAMPVCIRSSSGIEQKRSVAAMTAAIFV